MSLGRGFRLRKRLRSVTGAREVTARHSTAHALPETLLGSAVGLAARRMNTLAQECRKKNCGQGSPIPSLPGSLSMRTEPLWGLRA